MCWSKLCFKVWPNLFRKAYMPTFKAMWLTQLVAQPLFYPIDAVAATAARKTAINLAQTIASAIRRSETLDNVTVFIGGNPAQSDMVLALASQLDDMGYSVSYTSNQDSQLDLAELHACCDLYVATNHDTSHCEAEFVILDDQPETVQTGQTNEHTITVGDFLLVMRTAATCRRAWHA